MYNNWLVKLCSDQPKQEGNVAQQLEQLTIDEIREAVQPQPTQNLEDLQAKMAEADQMGRQLAREQGTSAAQAADRAAQQSVELQQAVESLSDEDAIKLAYVLENGTEEEKLAFMGALKGVLGGAAKKVLGSGIGRKAVGMAYKHPTAALALGGGLANKATGGSFTGGALGGAALGTLGGGSNRLRQGITSMATKFASSHQKTSFFHGESNEWLQQFEGSPLLQHAIDLEQQILQAEKQDLEQRVAERQSRAQERMENAERDRIWDIRDRLNMDKKLLELQLVAHRNGISEPDGDELGGEAMTADHPEPDADDQGMQQQPNPAEMAAESQPGTQAVEAIKQAMARKLAMTGATRSALSTIKGLAQSAGRAVGGGPSAATKGALRSVKSMSSPPIKPAINRLQSATVPGRAPGSSFAFGKKAGMAGSPTTSKEEWAALSPEQKGQASKNWMWQYPLTLGSIAGGTGAGMIGATKLLRHAPDKLRVPATLAAGLLGGVGAGTAASHGFSALNRKRHPELFQKEAVSMAGLKMMGSKAKDMAQGARAAVYNKLDKVPGVGGLTDRTRDIAAGGLAGAGIGAAALGGREKKATAILPR